ncbi:MAG: hypothetical protein AAF485_29095, partial [Chloroflexota bacterium]
VAYCSCLSMIAVGTIVYYAIFAVNIRAHKREAWKPFAKKHNLTFKRADLLGNKAHVTGEYNGRQVTLATKRQPDLQTSIIFSMEAPATYLDPHYIDPKPEYQLQLGQVTEIVRSFATITNLSTSIKGKFQMDTQANALEYIEENLIIQEETLQLLFDTGSHYADIFPRLVAFGGEAIPQLQTLSAEDSDTQTFVTPFLKAIAQETTERLKPQQTTALCEICFARVGPHPIKTESLTSLSYYGCRACGQSRAFLSWKGPIVAVLNHLDEADYTEQGDTLRINYLQHGALFDFDRVDIIQATDEEVERFAMQVGNDTDDIRKPKYAGMPYTISPACNLSENTQRILARIFGQSDNE